MYMKTLGIVGGMGPLATHDFYRKIIEATPAPDDPQHIPVVMIADTQIPLRIAAWEGRGESPLPALNRAASLCVNAGATVLAMPCNTAHYWFDAMVKALPAKVRFLHIADETLRAMQHDYPNAKRVALTGTHVTLAMNLYPEAASRVGHEVDWLLPDAAQQALITQAIAAVKAGQVNEAVALYQEAVNLLLARGAQAIVMGCTELPVLASRITCSAPLIDATDCLARACVAQCV
jgi:aspartate racemase